MWLIRDGIINICKEDLRETWARSIEGGVIPDALKDAWKEFRDHRFDFNGETFAVEIETYKDMIITWMIWWPFCLIWRIIDKLVLNFWKSAFEFCKGYFQRLVNFVFRNVDSSLLKK